MPRALLQVDVFTTARYGGNPVAVVLDGDGLSTEAMQRFAHWTNLSETTFVLPPEDPGADYLESADAVLALRPGFAELDIGVAGPHPAGAPEAFELRAPYVAAQGTALGRAGRVHVTQDEDGTVWVGGGTVTCIDGVAEL